MPSLIRAHIPYPSLQEYITTDHLLLEYARTGVERHATSTIYVYSERQHRACHCRLPGRSSIVHHIGLVVLMVTTFSSGKKWFDVDTRPPKDDSASAAGVHPKVSKNSVCDASKRAH